MKRAYIELNMGGKRLAIVEQANSIIAEYRTQGFDLTLRQLYYQFVARDAFPDSWNMSRAGDKWIRDVNGTPNNPLSYKNLGDIINDARMCGLVDWDSITDRTRNLVARSTWLNPAGIIKTAMGAFAIDKWEDQKSVPEVWIEKDALVGVIENICNEFQVAYFSCRGYTSQSEMWGAAQRIGRRWTKYGQTTSILHLGDHDPSGIDMSRDIEDRINLFTARDVGDTPFDLKRIALNMDQVKKYNPPPNPAKQTDCRYDDYRKKFGDESWELDALDPRVISDLISKNITALQNKKQWRSKVGQEIRMREDLEGCSTRWDEVVIYLNGEA